MPQSPVKAAWARFAKTGAPADYLAYRQACAHSLPPQGAPHVPPKNGPI